MKLYYESSCKTHIGLVRKNNQDSLLVEHRENFFSVADGLGGHLGGEVASSLALYSTSEHIKSSSSKGKSPPEIIKTAYHLANQEVYSQGQAHAELKGMGTTMVVMWVQDGKAYIGNVGDSRAYLHRDQSLWQLTDDHNVRAAYDKKGFQVQEKNLQSELSNALTRSVGFTAHVNPDIIQREAQEGDVYLLCSDGLHGLVSDSEILNCLNQENFKDVAGKLTLKALAAGGFDNISIVLVRVLSDKVA